MPAANLVLDQGSRYRWNCEHGRCAAPWRTRPRRSAVPHSGSTPAASVCTLTFNTDYVGTLHLYALDWDGTSRRQTVAVW